MDHLFCYSSESFCNRTNTWLGNSRRKTYYLHAYGLDFPLEPYFKNKTRPKFGEDNNKQPQLSTACHRGYKAIWHIIEKKLTLISIDTFVEGKKASVTDIVGKNNVAKWFSGNITVREFNEPWSPAKILTFEKGILKKISDKPNPLDLFLSQTAENQK